MSSPLIRLIIPFTLGMIGANWLIDKMDMGVLFILCCIVLAIGHEVSVVAVAVVGQRILRLYHPYLGEPAGMMCLGNG